MGAILVINGDFGPSYKEINFDDAEAMVEKGTARKVGTGVYDSRVLPRIPAKSDGETLTQHYRTRVMTAEKSTGRRRKHVEE